MANSAGTISVELTAEESRYVNAMRSATKSTKSFGATAEGIAPGMKKSARSADAMSAALAKVAVSAGSLALVKKSFDFAAAAQGTMTATKVFKSMGGNIDDLRKSMLGMVSTSELVKKANLAETMGISAEAFQRLGQVALAASAKTGASVKDMFSDIITGTARGSKAILDNLGIVINSESAYKKYAKVHKLVAKGLTDTQKKAAILNATLSIGEEDLRKLREAGIQLQNPFAVFSASMADAGQAISQLLVPGFTLLLEAINPVLTGIRDAGDMMGRLTDEGRQVIAVVGAIAISALVLLPVLAAAGIAISTFSSGLATVGTIASGAASGMAGIARVGVGKTFMAASSGARTFIATGKGLIKTLGFLAKNWRTGASAAMKYARVMVFNMTVNVLAFLINTVVAIDQIRIGFLKAGSAALKYGIRSLAALGPVLVPLAAIAAAIAGLVLLAGSITQAFSRAGVDMVSIWAKVGEFIRNLPKNIFSVYKTVFTALFDVMTFPFRALFDIVKEVFPFVITIGEKVFSFLRKGAKVVKDNMIDMFVLPLKAAVKMAEILSAIFATLTELGAIGLQALGLDGSADSLKSAGESVRQATSDASAFLATGAEKLKAATDFDNIVPAAKRAGEAIAAKGLEVGEAIADAVVFGLSVSAKEIGAIAGFGLKESVKGVKTILEGLGKGIGVSKEDLVKLVTGVKDALSTGGANAGDKIKSLLDKLKIDVDPKAFVDAIKKFFLKDKEDIKLVDKTKQKEVAEAAETVFVPAADKAIGPQLQGIGTEIAAAIQQTIAAIVGFVAAITGDERLAGAVGAGLTTGLTAGIGVFIAAFVAAAAAIGVLIVGTLGVIFAPFIALGVIVLAPFIALVAVLTIAFGALLSFVGVLLLFPAVIGGMAGAFASLIGETESMKKIQAGLRESFNRVIAALEPFAAGFISLVGLFDAFISVIVIFANAFGNLSFISEVVFNAFKDGALKLVGFLISVAQVQNALLMFAVSVIQVAQNIAKAFGQQVEGADDMKLTLMRMRVDIGKLGEAFVGLASLTFSEAEARGESLVLQSEQNDTQSAMNESMSNVPQGFKVASERFLAIMPGVGSAPGAGETLGVAEGAAGGIVIEGDLVIVDPDVRRLRDEIVEEAATETFFQAGGIASDPVRKGGGV